jgi:energy-coupling factor transport system substrate-specific component
MQYPLANSRIIDMKHFNTTIKIVLTGLLASSAIALRIFKHAIIGPIQIINLPAVFTILAGLILGPISGSTVGIISYVSSDFLLGFGPWTIVTSIFMGLIGGIFGLIKNKISNPYQLFILIVVFLFINDIFTSTLLYMLTLDFFNAFILSLIGLFLPVQGGFMIGIGPITEISSAFLVVISAPYIMRAISEVI